MVKDLHQFRKDIIFGKQEIAFKKLVTDRASTRLTKYIYPMINDVREEKGIDKALDIMGRIVELLDFIETKLLKGATVLLLKIPLVKWVIVGKYLWQFIEDVHKLFTDENEN